MAPAEKSVGAGDGMNAGGPGIQQQDVAGLDVPVDDPAVVGRSQAAGRGRDQREGLALLEPAPVHEQLAQAHAGHEFQDHVRDSVVLVELQQVDHVGIVGLRHQAGLLAEPPQDRGIVEPVRPQDLDRDDRAVARIKGPVYDPLPPLAQFLQQPIAPQPRNAGIEHDRAKVAARSQRLRIAGSRRRDQERQIVSGLAPLAGGIHRGQPPGQRFNLPRRRALGGIVNE